MKEKYEQMRRLSADIRIQTIQSLADAGFGHIGGSMSIADVLAVLYGDVMNIRPDQPDWDGRDYLVLSKGHCGPALYAALALKGYYPMSWLSTINKPETNLPSHADCKKTPGVDMTTGSLGQGISSAIGIALGNRLKGKSNRVFCIVGDGELQEGQIWEGVQFAVHWKLDNFILLVDYNKKQLDGTLEKIQRPLSLEEKFRAFGFSAETAVGYEVESIYEAIVRAKEKKGQPSVIILDTLKGIGCNFAEQAESNHYMDITQSMAEEARQEIERRYANHIYPRGEL